jgi:hypothetical protein
MQKILEKEASYYRLNLHAGNIIYFSHAKNVSERDYIDLGIKDVVGKIDELVEAYNILVETNANLTKENIELKNRVETLEIVTSSHHSASQTE